MDFATLGLRVDATQGVTGLRQFRSEAVNTANASSGLESAILRLGGVFAAFKVAEFGNETLKLAARYQTLGVVMDVVGRNVGKNATQMGEYQAALQKTGISMIESRNNLARMVGAQIDLANATDLARIAQNAAVIANTNSSEAFERLVTGISTGQTKILRTLGIFVDLDAAHQKYARQLGKTSDDLSEYEKTQANANAVMASGSRIAGAYESALGTANKQLSSSKRYLEDARVKFGEAFQPAYTAAVFAYADALKTAGAHSHELAVAATAVALVFGARWISSAAASMVEYVAKTQAATAANVASAEAEVARQTVVAKGIARDVLAAESNLQSATVRFNTAKALAASDAELAVAENAVANAMFRLSVVQTSASATATELIAAQTALTASMTTTAGAGSAMWAAIGGPIGAVVIAAYAAYKAIDYFANRGLKEADAAAAASQKKIDDFATSLQHLGSDALRKQLNDTKIAIANLAAVVNGPMGGQASQQQLDLMYGLLQRRAAIMTALVPIETTETEDAIKKAKAFKELIAERENELNKLSALNKAYDQSSSAIAILGLQYDAQAKRDKDATDHKGKELERLNGITDAMLAQQIGAVHLADELAHLEEVRARQKEMIDSHMAGVDMIKAAEIELSNADRLLTATQQGATAVAALNIQLAKEAALRETIGKNMTPQEIASYVELRGQIAAYAETIKTADDANKSAEQRRADALAKQVAKEKEHAEAIKSIWEESAKGVQRSLADGFQSFFTDGVSGLRKFADDMAKIVQGLISQIGAAMAAEAIGIDDMINTIKEKGFAGLSKNQKIGASGAIGFGIGYSIGQGTGDAGFSAISGAGAGALIGSQIAPGIGTAVGALAGLAGGILGAGAAAKKAKLEMEQLTKELEKSLMSLRGRISGNSLEADLFNAQQEQKDLLKANDDAYKSHDITLAEHNKNVVDIIELEAKYTQSLKDEFAAKQQQLVEDSNVRLLRATAHQQDADNMAFALAQQREYADAIKNGASVAGLAALQQAQLAEATQRQADQAEAHNRQIQDLSVRTFRAAGLSSTADDMEFTLQQERELADLRKSGASQEIIDATQQVLDMEKNAREQAIRDTNQKAQQDYTVRQLIAEGRDEDAERLRFQLQQQREYNDAVKAGLNDDTLAQLQLTLKEEWQKFLDDAKKATADAAAAMADLTRQTNEDLSVRALVAQGYTREAEDARRLLDQQREYQEAVKKGLDASTLAALTLVQASENAAVAAERAQQEQQTRGDLSVRLLTATGNTRGAEDLRLYLTQQRELIDARKQGYSPETIALMEFVQKQETAAVALQRAIADQTNSIKAAAEAQKSQIQGQIDLNKALLDIANDQLRTQQQLVDTDMKIIENLKQFADSLVLGNQTILPPIAKLAEARRQLEEAATAANGGDANAATSIPELIRTFLDSSRDVNASSTGYVSDFTRAQDIIKSVSSKFGTQLTVDQQMLQTLQQQTAYLQQQITELQTTRDAIDANAQAQIDALSTQIKQDSADADAQIELLKKQLEEAAKNADKVSEQTQILNATNQLNFTTQNIGIAQLQVMSVFSSWFTSGTGLGPLQYAMERGANAAEVSNFYLARIDDNTRTAHLVTSAGLAQVSDRVDALAAKLDNQTSKLSTSIEALTV